MLTFLLLVISATSNASDFKFMGYVKAKDITTELDDYHPWMTPSAPYYEMRIKIKGKLIQTYRVRENSLRSFSENNLFLTSLDKIKKDNENQDVIVILPNELTRNGYRGPRVYLKPDLKKGFLKIRKNNMMVGVFNPQIHDISFKEAGPFTNRDGAVDVFLNGKKILHLDGPSYYDPKSLGPEEGSFEEIYNDHALSATSENSRVFVLTHGAGVFRVINFIPQEVLVD